ncbi:restriction endonuclease [Arcobacter vandammei]|uniref:nSTAND3 domain-containing NTPase n=1 Tax=Arcobacter vandammei TaxID=2782243 RepID=UPI0018DFD06B|nr:restriction endonuclease [Arcobacter vandammei]
MIDYDFSTLNDKEFENLSIDLISKDRDKRFERFKAGKDGGIDGRFYCDNGSQEIVQCKHYLKTGFSGLITSLNKKNDKGINEIDKVKKLNPSKYIFVTSLQLSAENKKTIKDIFHSYTKNDNDIYGQEDLNQILGNYPDIEKRHYKLWLSNTVVLDRILNNAIESRSEFLLEDVKEKSKYYVVTENHQKAIDKLEESHIIIIAGEPGIGKTTLAEHLALWYVEKDFKLYNIENYINEAESVYKRDEKQIFYFDDFLGANYLNAIEDKKDSYIVKFMDRIKKDKTKRFILTSRTNIFNQSLALSDTFKIKNIENEEFIIKIESLKDIDKAHILYNHIWHSELDEEFIDEIYINKRYKDIIKHKNFNPRLIEFITDIKKIQLEKVVAKNYWEYILDKINNPQDIWKNTFDKQSDSFTRAIVMLTVFNGNQIEENKLRDSYYKYIELAGLNNSSHTSKEFDSIIEEVVKYFLNRNLTYSKKIEYSLFNPSIADFVLNRYKNNLMILKNIYRSLENDKSLVSLFKLNKNGFIKDKDYLEILDLLLSEAVIEKNIDYLIKLNHFAHQTSLNVNQTVLRRLIQKIINGEESTKWIKDFSNLLNLFNISEFIVSDFDFFSDIIFYASKDIDDINSLIKIYNYFSIEDKDVDREINDLITEYFKEELRNEADSIYEGDIEFENFINDEGCFEVIDGEVEQIIDSKYSELETSLEYFSGLNIDEYAIKDEIDIYDIKQRLSYDYTSEKYNDFSYEKDDDSSQKLTKNDIESLFER